MDARKVALFMELAGQKEATEFVSGDEATRCLGAQLLLSEVLEYIIKGLGVSPEFNGQKIIDPECFHYKAAEQPSRLEMLDGLCDVAYTMYWNALAFGIPLEQGFELVCDNNLEKFVALPDWTGAIGDLEPENWDCGMDIEWPETVVAVTVVEVAGGVRFAVGKDVHGKVRKPSSFEPVTLEPLVL